MAHLVQEGGVDKIRIVELRDHGTSPTGPFDYAGVLLPKVHGLNVHHSIVQYQGLWTIWFHLWPEGGPGQRRVYGEVLKFNPGGTIQPVSVTAEGVG